MALSSNYRIKESMIIYVVEHEIQVSASVSVTAADGLLPRPLCSSAEVQ